MAAVLCAATRSGVNDVLVSPLPMWKWIGSPASCADGPQAVPVRLAEEWEPEALRLAGEQDPAVTGGGRPLDLRHGRVDVPERDAT